MNGKVLVDTSVWIAFFRGKSPALTEHIGALLKSGRAVFSGIIALELIRGAKGQKELQTLYDAFDLMQCMEVNDKTYVSAGKLGYDLARKGLTISVVDLLIARTAMENGLSLMTYDEHFSVIVEQSALCLEKIKE